MRDGWLVTSLDETADVIMGQSPEGKSYNEAGDGIPFMQGSGEFGEHHPIPKQWCSAPKKIAQPGDLLLSVRAPVGDTNFADQRIAVGRGLSVIRANAKSSNEFLRLVIQFNVSEMISSSGTGMFSSITGKNLKGLKVVLPPLPEQKRIVDLISSVDSYIEALRQQLERAKISRNAVLHELLTAGGDDWVETILGDLVKIVPGKYVAKKDYVEDGDFWIYGSNSIMGKLDRFLVETAHVVMAAIGAYAGSVRYSGEPSWINNNAMALVPDQKTSARYLHYWLGSQLDLARVVVGTGQPYVRRPLLLKEVVYLPSLPEQQRTVDLISSIDSYIDALEGQINSSTSLRSGLLSDLLSGNHEIPSRYDQLIGAA